MSEQLEQFRMLIGGKAVDAISGRTFESENPYTGEPWAVIPDGGPEDVDAAVHAARAALDGEWGSMTGFGRARLLRLLADLISLNAERLARLEVNDSGKLYREMIGQLNGLGGWYHYYAGLADKLEGAADPVAQPELPRLHPAGAGRGGRRDHALELPAAADDLEAGPGPGRGLHGGDQAVRARARLHPGLRRADRGRGLPARRGQRGHRPVPRDSARPWPGTRGWTRWRSPGPPPPAGPWPTPRPRTSTRSPWSWAASRPRWCSPTPTWPRRPTASWPGCSRPPGRPAWPAPG